MAVTRGTNRYLVDDTDLDQLLFADDCMVKVEPQLALMVLQKLGALEFVSNTHRPGFPNVMLLLGCKIMISP